MNADLLSWKREAVAITQMEQQPSSLDGYGKKTCYIRIMKELWDAKGFEDLGLSSQSLRDAQTESAADSRVYAGGSLSREERFGENSDGFTTLSINGDLFHLEEESRNRNMVI